MSLNSYTNNTSQVIQTTANQNNNNANTALPQTYLSQFEFINNLDKGNNLTSILEGELTISKNNVNAVINNAKLFKLSGVHTSNTIKIKKKSILNNESSNDVTLVTFSTDNDSINELAGTINTSLIEANQHLYIEATQSNYNASFLIILTYTNQVLS
jgi:hypothetical protein